ncbi:UDP-D-apiose/UDP-D-xylose synthase 2 isoform X2 [Elaeis guineensis]|uniref:UDP-D-apiose/UDP-D-xylose synthase 2 isoform X2 n=1 Tax=Elaeis guineensis var. tenera TaxID=51953 RepID=UPI003C6D589F
MARVDLDGNPIEPMKICIIGAGGFIGSHLCDKLMAETPHTVLAVDVYSDKIKHLLEPPPGQGGAHPWAGRIQFHRLNIKHDSRLEGLIKIRSTWRQSALRQIIILVLWTPYIVISLMPFRWLSTAQRTLSASFTSPRVKYMEKRLEASSQRIILYGRFCVLKEDASPCIFGPIEKQRWSYACAKQLIERLMYAEGAENGLDFTIVRPFNWIGPRMDFIPGIDGPCEGIPRVLACFSNNLLRREPLKLVDGGQSQRTFVYIKDAIEAVLLMIENPARANGQIFNVGNPNNEVTVKQLAEMMTEVYSKVSGEPLLKVHTIDVSSKEFYGEGYDDSDKRILDMTIINKQLGWSPKTLLWDLLESTLTYQHRTYAQAIRRTMVKPIASS